MLLNRLDIAFLLVWLQHLITLGKEETEGRQVKRVSDPSDLRDVS